MTPFLKFAFIGTATALYGFQACVLLWTGDKAGATIMVGYILANVGLIWSLS